MFGKKDLVENLGHDLERARARRDALASDVTTLSAAIAELEARLAEEKNRRERARVAAEIDRIAAELADAAGTFAPAAARLCEAAAAAGAIVSRAGELSGVLGAFAGEMDGEIASLASELRDRAEMARSGEATVQLPARSEAAPLPSFNDRMPLVLPAFLRRRQVRDLEAADGTRSSAA
jgi:chromosome segregation ATPase